ncbi:alpha/beta hydrolase fold domain-containing protein [Novosphingobium sp. FSY-8]|uniref:Alpha/beta hydrolase fold domain-containing protein n=1 Tax=Novosphingobium ovatum TaxID=1908523 RepID=A0ABW9XDF7_9SPHN|nr:alpha/beta hydrolase [Novosphingobium ovatum]NBC36576.1 alpha/beta hydrolase fold domain-containing protein [Novosphingobium ovatum]
MFSITLPRSIAAAALAFGITCGTTAIAAEGPPPGMVLPSVQAAARFADVPYAPADPATSRGHLLDLYLPATPPRAGALLPVVIWTGGSAWLSDDGKFTARFMAPELLKAGFAVAGVSIRSSGQAQFPAQLHDIKAAIRFLRANAAQYGLDPNRIAIMGDSSGGWTTSVAAISGDDPTLIGSIGVAGGPAGTSSAVQAAVALYPPTAFLQMDAWSLTPCKPDAAGLAAGFCHDGPQSPESRVIGCAIQSCAEATQAADPVGMLRRQKGKPLPPIMILHGRADPLVPHNQGERLYKALAHDCREARFYSLPLAGHGPAWDFLQKAEIAANATLETSSSAGCTTTAPVMAQPGWGAVIAFLKSALQIGG